MPTEVTQNPRNKRPMLTSLFYTKASDWLSICLISTSQRWLMKDLKELTTISQDIQSQLLQRKLSFTEIRYVLSEVQTTFAIMQATAYLRKTNDSHTQQRRD